MHQHGLKLTAAFLIVATSLTALAGGPETTKQTSSGWYSPRISVGPFYSTEVDYFTLADVFAPLTVNQDSIFFLDARYRANKGTTHESNFGAGFRHIFANQRLLWGLYSFFDKRRSTTGNDFEQVTVGGELMTNHFSLSVNGYIPVGTTSIRTASLNQVNLVQNGVYQNIFYSVGVEKSLNGLDALAGYEIPHTHGLSLYAGFFHYWRKQVKTLTGPILHGEYKLDFTSWFHKPKYFPSINIALITDYQYDSVRKSRWFAGARFDFLIAHKPRIGIERRMTDFVRRDLNVETERANTGFHPFYMNGHIARVRQVSNDAGWVTARGDANTDIIGVNGSFANSNSQLQDNQTVTGGGFSFMADGTSFNAPIGSNGSMTPTVAANAVITAGVNNTIENIQLSGSTNAQIRNPAAGNSVGNLTIRNTNLSGAGSGIIVGVTAASTNSNVNIYGNTINNTAGDNINISSGTAIVALTANVNNNTLTNTGAGQGIIFNSGGAAGSSLTVGNINGNNVNTVGNALRTNSTTINSPLMITNISNNVLHSTNALAWGGTTQGASAIQNASNNTFQTDGNSQAVDIGANANNSSFTLSRFANNLLISTNNTTTSNAIRIGSQPSAFTDQNVVVSNLYGNRFQRASASNADIELYAFAATDFVIINTGLGPATSLSQANNNATVVTPGGGAGTIVVNPSR